MRFTPSRLVLSRWTGPGGIRRTRPFAPAAAATAAAMLAAGLLVPTAASTASAAESTVVTDLSSDFESGTGGWGGVGVSAETLTTEDAHGGNGVLAVEDTTEGWGAVIHDLKSVVQPGVTYTLTAYVRMPSGEGKVSLTVQQDDDFQNNGSYQVPVNDTEWTKLTRTYTLPAGAATPSTLQMYFEAADDLSAFWVDDVTVTHSTGGGTPSAMPLAEDFEDGDPGAWVSRGSAVLAVSDEQAHGGERSLLTTGRTANWHGPALDLTGKVTEGKEHSISVWVRLAGAGDGGDNDGADNVRMTIEKQAEGTDNTYTTVGAAAVTDGEWTKLSGTWTAPADATAITLYVEADGAETSFYIDDFAMDETGGTAPVPADDDPPVDAGDGTTTLFSHSFENGTTQGWTARGGGEQVALSSAVAHGGSHSLAVTGRTQSWNAPVLSVLDRFELGVNYRVSVWVRLAEGEADTTAKLTVERRLDGTPSYEGLTGGTPVSADGWTRISGTYTLATDVDFLTIYVETPGVEDFFVDDVLVTYLPTLPVQTDKPSLKDEFKEYWPVTGAAVSLPETIGNHATLLKKHFNSVTPGNAMKWDSIERVKGVKTYQEADRIVEFAQENGIGVYGHVLAWHSQMPDWVFQDDEGNELPFNAESKQLVLDRLAEHIRDQAGRYKGKVYAWDVVNEVISDEADETYRPSKYYRYTGLDFIRTAFRVARETDPDAQLCINDYNSTDPGKREKYFELVKQLLDEGVPVDCVGHQMHVHMDGPPAAEVDEALSMFAGLGVRQRITELDISVYPREDNTSRYDEVPAANLAAQQAQYVALYSTFLKHADDIDSVTTWGLADDNTWLSSFPIDRLNTPLLFDAQLQAKPVFDALIDLVRNWSPEPEPTKVSVITPSVTLQHKGTAVVEVELSGGWCLESGAKAVALGPSARDTVSASFSRSDDKYTARLSLGDRSATGRWDVYVDGTECSGTVLRPDTSDALLGAFRVTAPTVLELEAKAAAGPKSTGLELKGTLRRLENGALKPFPSAEVVIEFQAAGATGFTPVSTVTTGGGGKFSLTVADPKAGTWRATYAGGGELAASSATVTVAAQQTPGKPTPPKPTPVKPAPAK